MEAETVKKKAAPKRVAVYIPPEIIARVATADETPKVATQVAALAAGNGWEVSITYARGTTYYSTSPRLVHSVAVRAHRGPQQTVAVWTATVGAPTLSWSFELGARLGRWKCLFSLAEGVMPVRMSNTQLKSYLRSDLPINPVDLPVDIWAPTQASVDAMSVAGDVMDMFLQAAGSDSPSPAMWAGGMDAEILEGSGRLASLFVDEEVDQAV